MQKRNQFHDLDLLRGVAAIAVVLFHAHPLLGWSAVPGGYLAVDLFFILSGVVLAEAYRERFGTSLSFWGFVRTRAIRFSGFYIVGSAIGAVLLIVSGQMSLADAVAALPFAMLLLPSPISPTGDGWPFNAPSWSLAVEFWINLSWAFLVLNVRPSAARALLIATPVLFVAFVLLDEKQGLDFGAAASDFGPALFRGAAGFSVGLAIHAQKRHQGRSWRMQLPPALIVGGIISAMLLPIPSQQRDVFDLIFAFVISPFAIYALTPALSQNQAYSRIGGIIGAASYGLYALHYPLIWGVAGAIDLGSWHLLSRLFLTLTMTLALIAFASWAERSLDQPFRKWLTTKTRPPI